MKENHVRPLEQWPADGGDANRLRQALDQGNIPHAMLLTGSKTVTGTVARFIAKLLLCSEAAEKPCGKCPDCLQFDAGAHPNWHEVPIDGRTVKTQAIENLQSFLQLRSHGRGPLVYWVPEIDGATPVAANRLLKTLEEPPAAMVAILTADNVRQVLPTIVSRCHVYRLLPSEADAAEGADEPDTLEDNADTVKISTFAALFERVVQWTQSLLNKSEFPLVLASDFHKLEPTQEGDAPLDILLSWLSDLLHFTISGEPLHFPNYQRQIAEQAALASGPDIAAFIRIVLDAKIRTGSHVVGLLNIEQMCIKMRRVLDGLHGGGSPV